MMTECAGDLKGCSNYTPCNYCKAEKKTILRSVRQSEVGLSSVEETVQSLLKCREREVLMTEGVYTTGLSGPVVSTVENMARQLRACKRVLATTERRLKEAKGLMEEMSDILDHEVRSSDGGGDSWPLCKRTKKCKCLQCRYKAFVKETGA